MLSRASRLLADLTKHVRDTVSFVPVLVQASVAHTLPRLSQATARVSSPKSEAHQWYRE